MGEEESAFFLPLPLGRISKKNIGRRPLKEEEKSEGEHLPAALIFEFSFPILGLLFPPSSFPIF
jgi:hypothetical protein